MMLLSYQTWGMPENPTLLFLHGFMGSSANWERIATQLSDQFYIVAPDLPGHGESLFEDSADYSMPQAAQAVIALLDKLAVQQCTLIGYSMGGRLALYLATHFPERFAKVVLESALPGIADAVERATRKRWDNKIAKQLLSEPFPNFLNDWYSMSLFASLRAHPNFEQAVAKRLQNEPAQLARSMREMGTGSQQSLWEAWGQVKVETLLIVGEWDAKYVGISAEMAQLNRYSQVRIVKSAGHNVHFERPNDYIELLKEFLLTDDAD